MSDDHSTAPEPSAPPAETPAAHIATEQKKKNLYLRVTSSMPLLVTVIVHVVLGIAAAAVVVQQTSAEKKKTFEAGQLTEAAPAVEHRLQVARRGSASGGASSPVAANRIYTNAAGALALPDMPELPSMGAGGFGGFGGMGGVGSGAGSGMSTAMGSGAGLGGRGFMSLSFLGTTSQNASKIVFVVDTSTFIMEPRKGGFRAFTIIREEIMRLVSKLSPSAQFNVVLFRNSGDTEANGVEINVFKPELVPANSDHKTEFFAWMTPVNSQLGSFGPNSARSRTPWRSKPIPPEAGVDPLLLPPVWSRAAQVALEQKADTVFVITASQGTVRKRVDEATIAKRREESDRRKAEFDKVLEREGLDAKTYYAARDAALRKASAELAAANRRLVAAGKDPIVVDGNWKIFEKSVQDELKKHGVTITLDRTGWSKKNGDPLNPPNTHVSSVEGAEWNELLAHVARLQKHLLSERAALNLFLFVGPNDNPESAVANLTQLARRNGGTFQLLTTARLEELRAREEKDAAR